MRLRGALLPCGPGVRGVAWPDTPRVRLAALGSWLRGDFAASHLTAAWVWGATEDPPRPLTIAAPAGRHTRPVQPEVRYYELRFAPDDLVKLGDFTATAPLRTVLDLLHDQERFDRVEQAASVQLLDSLGMPAERLLGLLEHRRRPHVRLARSRLEELLRLEGVTNGDEGRVDPRT
jgi:hypothetical protein